VVIDMAKKKRRTPRRARRTNGYPDLTFIGLAAEERPRRCTQPRHHPAARRPVERRLRGGRQQHQGTLRAAHAYGRLQFGEDLDLHFRTLIGTGANPNVAAVIVIGIEDGWTKRVVDGIAKTGSR